MLAQAEPGRVRPPPLPRRGRGARLRLRHAAEGLAKAPRPARRGGEGAVRLPARVRDRRSAARSTCCARGSNATACKFELAYFMPGERPQPEHRKLYEANVFTVMRQLALQREDDGHARPGALPERPAALHRGAEEPAQRARTVERRDPPVPHDRDPREPLFAFGRCLAHFAVDTDLVYVTTQLEGDDDALPAVQQGQRTAAPATRRRRARLRDRLPVGGGVAARQRPRPRPVLRAGRRARRTTQGSKTGEKSLIFPRYHQLDSVRGLVVRRDRRRGRAELPDPALGRERQVELDRLARAPALVAHDEDDQRVFDSVIVVTDRRCSTAVPARRCGSSSRRAGSSRTSTDLAAAQGGAGGGQEDHRHDAAEVPGDRATRLADAAGQALRGDRGRGPLVAERRVEAKV